VKEVVHGLDSGYDYAAPEGVPEAFLTTAQVGPRLGVTAGTVAVYCRRGLLEGAHKRHIARGGAEWAIPESAVRSFLDRYPTERRTLP
jgi:hypothetical protein